VRLTSNDGERFDWMIGGFYFDESVEILNDFRYGQDFRSYANVLSGNALGTLEGALGLPVGGAFGQTGQGPIEEFGQDNEAFSLFGTLDFYATERLTATVGINYTNDEKSAFGRATNTDAFSGLSLTQVGYNLVLANILGANGVNINNPAQVGAFVGGNPAAFASIQQTALAISRNFNPATPANTRNPLAGLVPLQFLPPFLGFPNAVEDGQSSDSDTTYTLRLAYDLTDDINVYGSYATGFKATSWNLSRDSRPFATDFTAGNEPVRDPITTQVFPGPASPIRDAGLAVNNLTSGTRLAGPEESAVFEIGLKAQFDRVAVNLALFDQTIEGFQSNVFTGTGFALANAGEQSNQGVELDLTWTPVDQLLLSFAGTFQDPVYDSFPNSASGDLSGQQPAGISEVITSTAGTFFFDVQGMDAFLRADWQYESPTAFFDSPANQALIGEKREVSLVNASAGLETANGLAITVWARNLFDDEFVTTAFPSVAQAGSISGYPNQPRTFGVTLRKSF
jgi:iron complex outermembrane recepter protein